ncbi:hypothetical protein RF11_10907 [Thelohanellus kitauei]|uniref:Uncharacterized protein n=1 Tax=Thelohanellus kitauei TaxID=669202 RepID=A0A0C2J8L8_THEKT|nr:hypothetical protein RF11_10907 [Thelohanellus kitauei]
MEVIVEGELPVIRHNCLCFDSVSQKSHKLRTLYILCLVVEKRVFLKIEYSFLQYLEEHRQFLPLLFIPVPLQAGHVFNEGKIFFSSKYNLAFSSSSKIAKIACSKVMVRGGGDLVRAPIK